MKKFIHLPAKIHKGHSNWIPPIYSDDWAFFSSKKNKSFGYSDVIMLLAYRGGDLVGRIMGIINRKYNEERQEKHARFNYLESLGFTKDIDLVVYKIKIPEQTLDQAHFHTHQ